MMAMSAEFHSITVKSFKAGASRTLRRLVHDDSGQSMTEYILILAMVLMIFSKLKGVFLQKIMGMVNKVGDDMGEAASDTGSG